MNWKHLRHLSWIDTRARFVDHNPPGGSLLYTGSAEGKNESSLLSANITVPAKIHG
jgi:hypothetical protein